MVDRSIRAGSAAIAAAGLVIGLAAGCGNDSSGDGSSGMASATMTLPMWA